MKRKKGTADGRLIMACNRCGMENRVTPKGIPAEGFEKIHGIIAKPDYESETRPAPESRSCRHEAKTI